MHCGGVRHFPQLWVRHGSHASASSTSKATSPLASLKHIAEPRLQTSCGRIDATNSIFFLPEASLLKHNNWCFEGLTALGCKLAPIRNSTFTKSPGWEGLQALADRASIQDGLSKATSVEKVYSSLRLRVHKNNWLQLCRDRDRIIEPQNCSSWKRSIKAVQCNSLR